jgi:hypothetical protein
MGARLGAHFAHGRTQLRPPGQTTSSMITDLNSRPVRRLRVHRPPGEPPVAGVHLSWLTILGSGLTRCCDLQVLGSRELNCALIQGSWSLLGAVVRTVKTASGAVNSRCSDRLLIPPGIAGYQAHWLGSQGRKPGALELLKTVARQRWRLGRMSSFLLSDDWRW